MVYMVWPITPQVQIKELAHVMVTAEQPHRFLHHITFTAERSTRQTRQNAAGVGKHAGLIAAQTHTGKKNIAHAALQGTRGRF